MESTEVTYFGKTNFRNNERIFGIKQVDRRQHMYVIGQTGTGKSTLLKNMALQDIKNGHGICIVDPHGEFVEGVLEKIPSERIKDVVYFNPADSDYPIGFNVLEVPGPEPEYKNLAASSLMGIFTKIWANVWSSRMEYILNNAVLALLDTPGTTLMGIMRMLVDKEYRKKIIDNVKNPMVRAFWIQEYEQWDPKFRNEAIAPIQNKVGQFLANSLVRNILGQPKSSINIYDIMNEGKILLVNVSKGRIGEDNSALLGAMMITKIQLAAMERIRILESDRKDFYLYVDEFQNFATDSFASILSEARKYRLNLVIAHQYMGQLVTDTSTKVRDAVFGNVGTMITFRVGATDAEFLEKEFAPEFAIQDLVNLPNHSIYLKIMVDNMRSRPFSAGTLRPLKIDTDPDVVAKVIAASRKSFGQNRAEVEEEMHKWSEVQSRQAPVSLIRRGESASSSAGPRFQQQQPPPQSAPIRTYAPRQSEVVASREYPQKQEPPVRATVREPSLQEVIRKVSPRLGELVVRAGGPQARRTISLSDLAKPKTTASAPEAVARPREEHRRPAIDRDALRKALGDSLQGKKISVPPAKITPPPPAREETVADKKAPPEVLAEPKGNTIKPGEVIKF
jgi:hypothetical protein